MKSRLKNGIEVKRGSGNVYADLGLADAEKLKIKTGLVIEIRKAMRSLGLTQQEAAKRMSISQPKVSDMMRGDFTNLSERKLMDCLTRLGYDIEISVRPAKSALGHLVLAAAGGRFRIGSRLMVRRRIAEQPQSRGPCEIRPPISQKFFSKI